jgi:hypothetical protein
MAKLNIKEAFSKMSKFQMIATILLMAALALLIVHFIGYYLIDIIAYNMFKAMFSSVYQFYSIFLIFTLTVVDMAFAAGLILSLLVGSKKNFAIILIMKAAVAVCSVLFLTPFAMFLFKLSYPNGTIDYGNMFYSFFIQITLAAGYCLLGVLLLGGFKKIAKVLGFVSAGVIALVSIRYIINFFTESAALVRSISAGEVTNILDTIFCDYPQTFAYIGIAAALVLVALGFTFAVLKKSAKKPNSSQQAEQK